MTEEQAELVLIALADMRLMLGVIMLCACLLVGGSLYFSFRQGTERDNVL